MAPSAMAGGALRLFTTLMTAPRHPCYPANGQSSDKSGRTVWSAPRLQCLGTLRPGLALPALLLSCVPMAAHAARGTADGSGEAGSGSGDGAPQSESAQSRPSGLELPVPLFDRQIVVVGDRAIVSQLSDVAPTLASLVPFANKVNDSRIGDFRTLRGASQPLEASLSGNKTLAHGFRFRSTGGSAARRLQASTACRQRDFSWRRIIRQVCSRHRWCRH